jgi:phytoene synthase
MKFEISRAREFYRDGLEGVKALSPAGQITTIASSHLYAKILNRIEEQEYDVFHGRAYVPTHHKVQAVPTIAASFLRLRLDMTR